jgi:phosphate-selective porin OprO/OprP
MFVRSRKARRAAALALAAHLTAPVAVHAQGQTQKRESRAELEERVRRLEKIIQENGLDKPAGTAPVHKGAGAAPAAVAAPTGNPAVDQEQVEAIVDEKIRKQKVVAGWKDGFFLESSNGDFKLKLRGLLQTDARFMPLESGDTNSDTFWLRRVRPIFDGTVYKYFDFKIMPDFGNGKTVLQDAYADITYFGPWAKIRGGKFKGPFSLERLQSAADLLFVERSLTNALAPNRDIGAQLYGDLFDGRAQWQVAFSNGNVDGGSNDGDQTSDKEFTARLWTTPFSDYDNIWVKNLGFGFAGNYGKQNKGDNLSANVAYKTAGQATYFKYVSSSAKTVYADGDRTRVAPQAYWYVGPFGLMGEYIISGQGAQLIDTKAGTKTKGDYTNSSWFVQASYVLTGEDASFKGVNPINPFDPFNGRWGAFELAARGSQMWIDQDLFREGLADKTAAAKQADNWGIGVNWYLNRNVRLMANWEHTWFDRYIKFGGNTRDHEDAILGRFQLAF